MELIHWHDWKAIFKATGYYEEKANLPAGIVFAWQGTLEKCQCGERCFHVPGLRRVSVE